jgi:hypothetical protein
MDGSQALRLADPPILSFEVRGGEGMVREQSASNGTPFLLTRMDLSKRIDEHDGTSLWLAPDLRWWTRRAETGLEAYRVLVHPALGFMVIFEAERRGAGGVLEGTCACGAQRQWELSPDDWQSLRGRANKILDADSHGGRCGRDGWVALMEAVSEGRWRVVERDCDDVGELLSFLRSREAELVRACPRP